jgi:hypothetical protein
VYAELYHRLLIDADKRDSTEQRLEMLGRDLEWLADLKRLYRTYWQWQIDNHVGDHRKPGKMISELRGQRSAKFGSS